MAEPPSSSFKYKPAPLFPLPPQLHPATYDVSLEKRTTKAKLMAIRSRLKRHYLLELSNPQQTSIDDPAVTPWVYARMYNAYPNFHVTPKTSLLGAAFRLEPIFFWWFLVVFSGGFKTDGDRKEKLIQEGKYERSFPMFY
ncbi:dehydrogenase [ubiquinone] 1 beta subcomplex subunit 4 [Podarcis lilfordi]|uniref:NADH dehydrogenase [ubiquinone] 1 beta subcomplex subunit 4 n=1 Tax=Podarcis lilfordi TaxID=74358 RepID=A0AA35KW24_9SAUR|nr:dehydrogenase [ubiquinone] 1 beta subcomplex subunit 4 [Podarcis lilfordi]